jgi:hypothetical protein
VAQRMIAVVVMERVLGFGYKVKFDGSGYGFKSSILEPPNLLKPWNFKP